jgi:hypothetical protein
MAVSRKLSTSSQKYHDGRSFALQELSAIHLKWQRAWQSPNHMRFMQSKKAKFC